MKPLAALLGLMLLNACSTVPQPPEPPPLAPMAMLNGTYEMSGQPMTDQDRNGQACHVHFGTMRIENGQVQGNIVHFEHPVRMDFNGQVSANGELFEGLGYAGESFGQWQGLFGDNSGQGVWKDNLDCSGIWFATRVQT